ncbi:MAG: D-alanyl-D-alanine carboxypeptidase family protein [Bacillota bacterium]
MRTRASTRWVAAVLVAGLLWPGVAMAAADGAAPLIRPTAAMASTAASLDIKAVSAVLIDAGSGQVLLVKNSHERRAIASMTKLMTLVLAFEAIEAGKVSLQDKVTAGTNAFRLGGAQIWLVPGEVMVLEDMLRAVAMQSANDASVAVGEYIAGSVENFVDLMNQRAKELGMADTHYMNPHGLDEPDHYSSAYDMAVLGRQAVKYPKLLEFTKTWQYYLRVDPTTGKGKTWLVNTNRLLVTMPGVDGLKTGFTNQSLYCLTATMKRGDLRLIAVVMGLPEGKQRFDEAGKLLNFGFANYTGVPVAKADEKIGEIPVQLGVTDKVEVMPEAGFSVTVPKGKESGLKREIQLPKRVYAPVLRGAHLGVLLLTRDGQEVGRVNLVAAASVKRVSYFRLVGRLFGRVIRGE